MILGNTSLRFASVELIKLKKSNYSLSLNKTIVANALIKS